MVEVLVALFALVIALVINYAIYFGVSSLGYWFLCLAFGWEFNVFIPLAIAVFCILLYMVLPKGNGNNKN